VDRRPSPLCFDAPDSFPATQRQRSNDLKSLELPDFSFQLLCKSSKEASLKIRCFRNDYQLGIWYIESNKLKFSSARSMSTTGKLPDPDEDNRNTERRFSHERTLPTAQERTRTDFLQSNPLDFTEHPECERIELRVSKSFYDVLQMLADHEQTSNVDIIRKAVSLYAFAEVKRKEGMSIGVIAFSEDNEPEIIEIIDL